MPKLVAALPRSSYAAGLVPPVPAARGTDPWRPATSNANVGRNSGLEFLA